MRPLLLALALLAASASASAQDRPVAFVGATVYPIAGPRLDAGTVVVQGGRIVAVGPTASVRVPAGAEVIDAAGKVMAQNGQIWIGRPPGAPAPPPLAKAAAQ